MRVRFNAGAVNGNPTRYMPWWIKGSIIDSNVDSWPPCIDVVEVNTAAGLRSSVPLSQSALVPSRKYFKGAAMLPNRVGLPRSSPSHSLRSSCVA